MKATFSLVDTSRFFFFSVTALSVFVGVSAAQSSDLDARRAGMTQVQDNNRIMSASEKDKAAQRNKEERMAVVNESFKRLQILHNEMMTMMSSDKSVDGKKIIETAEEVKLRATELNANLALPQISKEKDKKQSELTESTPVSITDHMSGICSKIRDFAKNVNLSPTDPKAGLQARRDLIALVNMSDQLIFAAKAPAAKP